MKRGILPTLAALALASAACASPTPTPTPTATPPPTPTQPVFEPSGGPSFIVYDTILVELIVPEQVSVGEEVLFQLAFANIGDEARTFYHRADVAEFILTKDGEQVMSSFDQLQFPQPVNYTNTLGPHMTRRLETGFDAASFLGLLIDKDGRPLPPGSYEIHGVARLSSEDDGTYEAYATPLTTIEIVGP